MALDKFAFLKIFKARFIIYLLVTGLICCDKNNLSNDCIDPSKIKTDYICFEIYQPICGCDKKTYSNSCYAEVNGLKIWTEGECE